MNLYLLFKSIHLLGAVLFLGNIIITGWWKTMADRTGDPLIIAFAQRQVTLTDFIFTAGGALLVLVGGLSMAMLTGNQKATAAAAPLRICVLLWLQQKRKKKLVILLKKKTTPKPTATIWPIPFAHVNRKNLSVQRLR